MRLDRYPSSVKDGSRGCPASLLTNHWSRGIWRKGGRRALCREGDRRVAGLPDDSFGHIWIARSSGGSPAYSRVGVRRQCRVLRPAVAGPAIGDARARYLAGPPVAGVRGGDGMRHQATEDASFRDLTWPSCLRPALSTSPNSGREWAAQRRQVPATVHRVWAPLSRRLLPARVPHALSRILRFVRRHKPS